MRKKEIVANVSNVETRIALMVDGLLQEYYLERPKQSSLVGHVYKAKVINLMSGLKAAFVNIGIDRNGFLPLTEIPFEDFSELFESDVELEHEYRPEEIKLKKNQEIVVQVTKDSYGVKGPRVTSFISIPGRYIVLLINAKNIGVSRKIRHRREREILFKIGKQIKPGGMGLIIRTAAARAKSDEIKREVEVLKKNWERNLQKAKDPAPVLIYQEPDAVIKTVRDLFNNEIRNLYIDSESGYRKILSYLGMVSPRMRSRVKLYNDPQAIFKKFNIEEQLKDIHERKIWLRSGGYIVIDQTEALVAIDVNTGKSSKEKQAERLAFSTNLEALREIARQLRLRDIGGLVIVDLIDLEKKENINRMLREFKSLIRGDRARYRIGGISEFGLLEFTRERSRISVTHALSETCPVCKGKGRIVSRQSTMGYIERWFLNNGETVKGKMVELRTSPRLADFLSLHHADTLARVSKKYNLILRVKGDYAINDGDFKVVVV
ncbi:Rne/Rng family ribonuclease [candidate division WOR-3 bacterium]|nr:Rne/Rng family ribonuclease [candidate division WOR-3 bacterium]